jgi:hypothetical protein
MSARDRYDLSVRLKMALAKQLGVALGVHVERFARTYR